MRMENPLNQQKISSCNFYMVPHLLPHVSCRKDGSRHRFRIGTRGANCQAFSALRWFLISNALFFSSLHNYVATTLILSHAQWHPHWKSQHKSISTRHSRQRRSLLRLSPVCRAPPSFFNTILYSIHQVTVANRKHYRTLSRPRIATSRSRRQLRRLS